MYRIDTPSIREAEFVAMFLKKRILREFDEKTGRQPNLRIVAL